VEAPSLTSPWRELLALGEPKGASLCMIVRDEATHLGRLLDSIAGMASELVIVDTGSKDETVAIAEAHGARVVHHAWTGDFAAARNESLKHATGDWVLRLDADQIVDASSRRGFRRFLQRETHPAGRPAAFLAQLQEHLGDATGPAARGRTLALFANDPAIASEGALHQQLVDTAPGRGLHLEPLNDLVIHHPGYSGGMADRHARNVGILRRELERAPDDPALHHGLAQELRGIGDHAGAIAHLERARALAPADSSVHAAATILLAESHMQRRDWGAALAVLDVAIARGLGGADVFGMRGHARLMVGRVVDALADLTAAVAHRGAIGAGLLARGYDGWFSRLLLAFAHDRAGALEAADHAMREARAEAPDDPTLVRRALGVSEALTGDRATAARLLVAAGIPPRPAP
jgi:tetratricopeptide (TPR) repeat protein